jgi:hypothetical protein
LSEIKPIRKSIYFDPVVLDALRAIQQPQESLSLAISRLLKIALRSPEATQTEALIQPKET